MSNIREQKLLISDASAEEFVARTAEFDENVDWTDDTDAVLAVVRVNSSAEVALVRADLRQLWTFLGEILAADEAFLAGEDDE